MKRFLVASFALSVLFCIGISIASASSLSTVASIPRAPSACSPTVTICPPTPTPAPQSGGSTNGGGGHSGDEDGDGIPDGIDQCPNEGGPSSNQGCPAGRILTTAGTPSLVVLPPAPLFGPCVMATRTDERVNMHFYPSLSSPAVPFGWLDPTRFYTVDAKILVSDGTVWYQHDYSQSSNNIPWGFALSTVVRFGGDCSHLLTLHWPAMDSNAPQVSYAGLHIGLIKGSDPGTDTPNGYCSPAFGIDVTSADGSHHAIDYSFGDGSVQPTPEQSCINLSDDGHSFAIEPPPDPDGNSGFPTLWSVGYLNNQLTLLAFLQPNPGGTNPPEPDKPGVTLAWSFAPPDVCKTGGQDCHTPGALNFVVGWSQASDANHGLAFSWGLCFPPIGKQAGDQSCAEGSGRQGVLVNFMPASQNVAVNFFPNGFDPSIGGFTQIENQPGGSSPGDKYGFTQIENQPLTGQITVDFELPAVQ